MKLKVLILNANYSSGGAAIAALRLYNSLNKTDRVEVEYLSADDVFPKKISYFLKKIFTILDKWRFLRSKSRALFSGGFVTNYFVKRKIRKYNPDILHLHWINSGTLSIRDIYKFNIPVVWSLHDMWPFTGGCHYSSSCNEFYINCNQCPLLETKYSHIPYKYLNLKAKYYSKVKNLTLVGLSKWIQNEAEKSALNKYYNTVNLPNTIDRDNLYFIDKEKACANFGIDFTSKKLLGFGAVGAKIDPRKGYQYIINALKLLDNNIYEVVIFGSKDISKEFINGFLVHNVGYLNSPVELCNLYNAIDIFVVPSLQENLSNMIMESLFCNTPVVAFDIGGNSDMIKHKDNGYLASSIDSAGLAEGIEYLSSDSFIFNNKNFLIEFDQDTIIGKYIKLYDDLSNE